MVSNWGFYFNGYDTFMKDLLEWALLKDDNVASTQAEGRTQAARFVAVVVGSEALFMILLGYP